MIERRVLVGLVFLVSSALGFCQGVTPEWIPLREILAGRKTDQLVYVEGTSGALVAEGSTTNTRLYSLRDVFGQSIRVRTSDLDFQMGRSYGVRGTVTRQGREFILIEDVRAAIGRVREGGSRAEFNEKTGSAEPGNADSGKEGEKAADGATDDGKAKDGENESGAEASKEDGEKSILQSPAVIGGGSALALAIIIGWAVSSQKRKKQEEERRRRDRELEEIRKGQQSASQRRPTEVAPGAGGSSSAAAPKVARDPTLQSWGAVKVESGPGTIVGGGHLTGAQTIIGREEGQIVIHGDPLISGKEVGHGKILLATDGRATYVDNSTNGSKVNGKPVHHSQVELSSGDLIEIGQTALRFESSRQQSPAQGQPGASRAPTQAFVAPSSQATGIFTGVKVSILSGPGAGKDFSLLQAVTKIGRAPGQDIELDDTTASREHCEIHVRDGKLFLTNQSQNGTALGSTILREKGAESEIKDGDEFQMGGTRMKLIGGASPG